MSDQSSIKQPETDHWSGLATDENRYHDYITDTAVLAG